MTRPGTRRRWPRRLGFVAVVLAVIVGGAFGYTRAIDMNGPVFLARYLSTPSSEVGRLFPYRTVAASDTPRPLPERLADLPPQVPWKGDRVATEDVLRTTRTNALLVMCRGTLVHQWYRQPDDETSRQSSWSVAKSVVGLLVGQLIGQGRLTERTRLVEVLPEYANGTDFDTITVGDLLDMRSGIDVAEDYSYFKPFVGVGGLQVTTDLPGYLMKNRGLRFEPGSRSEYRSVDAQYLSMIVARVAGRPLAEVAHDQLWEPIGAQDEARWNLDREAGTEKGFAALNATPRDFAKIGVLVENRGRVGDRQVVPEAWIDRLAEPRVEALPHWDYSALWWHPPGHERYRDYSAIGVYGQFVYVDPVHHAVVVKLSDYGAEQDEAETIDVFRSLTSSCT